MLASDKQAASRVQALDLLRFVAVAAVIFYHYGFWGPSSHDNPQVALPWMASFAQYGFLGVPVFFIISGFVIAYSAEGRTATGFAIARFSRIYPTFLFCMTLTCLTLLTMGQPRFETSFAQWCANLFIAAPALDQPYMDAAYWSLVIEVAFYAWVTVLMAAKVFPHRLDLIILIWLGMTFTNELTVDAPIFEKLFLADDSGFFAVGLVIYEFHRGRRDLKLYALLALSVGTAIFQSLHKLIRLETHHGSTFDDTVVFTICIASIAVIFFATRLRRLPLPSGLIMAIGGLTYPLYLLHMQLGYVILSAFAPPGGPWAVAAVICGIVVLSWVVWRYIERPARQVTKTWLTAQATQRGWSVSASQTDRRTSVERSPA